MRILFVRAVDEIQYPGVAIGPINKAEDDVRQVVAAGDLFQFLVESYPHHPTQAGFIVRVKQGTADLFRLLPAKCHCQFLL